jgi:hypothetical protein
MEKAGLQRLYFIDSSDKKVNLSLQNFGELLQIFLVSIPPVGFAAN